MKAEQTTKSLAEMTTTARTDGSDEPMYIELEDDGTLFEIPRWGWHEIPGTRRKYSEEGKL